MTRRESTPRGVVVGALLVLACACGEPRGDETPAPRFGDINAEILEPKCTFACHSGGELAAGGLDLEADPHAALVDAAPSSPECTGSQVPRVTPGDPEASLVYLKIVARTDEVEPPCGARMPPSADQVALTAEEAERVRAWIEAGAKDD